MFSIEIDGKRHTARPHLEALELLAGAGYADELVSKSHTVTIRYGL